MFQTFQHLPKALRNILRCSYLRFLGELDYPNSILPKRRYKPIININDLIKEQAVWLIRRSNKNFDDTFDKVGNEYFLKGDVIPRSDVPSLSLNLLGGYFDSQHIKYRTQLKKPASNKWDGKTIVYLSDHLDDFVVVEDCSPIFIDANAVHDAKVPYKHPVDNDVKNFYKSLNKELVEVDNKTGVEGKTVVVHDPINLNYWHVELKVLDYSGKEVNYKGSKWIKDYCQVILDDVIALSAFPTATSADIPKPYYIR